MHKNIFSPAACDSNIILVKRLEHLSPERGRDEEGILSAPVVAENQGVDLGARPELHFLAIKMMDPPKQAEKLWGLVGKVKVKVLRFPDELKLFKRPGARLGQDELVMVPAKFIHLFYIQA
jgi:hypothetical protein